MGRINLSAKAKACTFCTFLLKGGSIYPLRNSKENTDSLHVYCARLLRATKHFFFSPPFEAAAAAAFHLHCCVCVCFTTVKLWPDKGFSAENGLKGLQRGVPPCFNIAAVKSASRVSISAEQTHGSALPN